MPIAFIGIGSNLGDREFNIRRAIQLMGCNPKINVLALSSLYETEPVGFSDQPDFLNCVVKAETQLPPRELLRSLKEIEGEIGRRPGPRWGPRRIDLDILFYEDLTLDEEELTIPHPKAHERLFVLIPLREIAPDLIHPRLGRSVRQLIDDLDKRDQGVRLYGKLSWEG
jgi:2-amino-4-hydroxy-6-hydroxymethyldihydropteridine diphosphokinase